MKRNESKKKRNELSCRENKQKQTPNKCKYEDKGRCREGRKCTFFHPVEICTSFSKLNFCSRSHECRRTHPLKVCSQWKQYKYCNYGNKFTFRYPETLKYKSDFFRSNSHKAEERSAATPATAAEPVNGATTQTDPPDESTFANTNIINDTNATYDDTKPVHIPATKHHSRVKYPSKPVKRQKTRRTRKKRNEKIVIKDNFNSYPTCKR